jgi:hypothetical protein
MFPLTPRRKFIQSLAVTGLALPLALNGEAAFEMDSASALVRGHFLDVTFDDSIDLPQGTYSIRWINPATGAVVASGSKECSGGELVLETPRYSTDIALRMDRLP